MSRTLRLIIGVLVIATVAFTMYVSPFEGIRLDPISIDEGKCEQPPNKRCWMVTGAKLLTSHVYRDLIDLRKEASVIRDSIISIRGGSCEGGWTNVAAQIYQRRSKDYSKLVLVDNLNQPFYTLNRLKGQIFQELIKANRVGLSYHLTNSQLHSVGIFGYEPATSDKFKVFMSDSDDMKLKSGVLSKRISNPNQLVMIDENLKSRKLGYLYRSEHFDNKTGLRPRRLIREYWIKGRFESDVLLINSSRKNYVHRTTIYSDDCVKDLVTIDNLGFRINPEACWESEYVILDGILLDSKMLSEEIHYNGKVFEFNYEIDSIIRKSTYQTGDIGRYVQVFENVDIDDFQIIRKSSIEFWYDETTAAIRKRKGVLSANSSCKYSVVAQAVIYGEEEQVLDYGVKMRDISQDMSDFEILDLELITLDLEER